MRPCPRPPRSVRVINDWLSHSFHDGSRLAAGAGIFLLAAGLSGAAAGGTGPDRSPSQTAATRTDSEPARIYLEWLEHADWPPPGTPTSPLPPSLAHLDRIATSGPLGREALREFAARHSTDLAALLFARSILAEPRNAALAARFEVERATSAPTRLGDSPTVLFVPGFLYRSHPETGGDFSGPRAHLESLGVPTRRVETDEAGAVEANAARVAATIRRHSAGALVVVSASKAGAEVALALGSLLTPEEARRVTAWINIGGILGGSPLADHAWSPSRRWMVRLVTWWKGWGPDGVRSLRTVASRRRFEALAIPPEIRIINVVAVPLSGDMTARARDGYRRLRTFGPNDGLALLADQLVPHGTTLLRLGDDHFFTRQDTRQLTRALLAIVHRDAPQAIPPGHPSRLDP